MALRACLLQIISGFDPKAALSSRDKPTLEILNAARSYQLPPERMRSIVLRVPENETELTPELVAELLEASREWLASICQENPSFTPTPIIAKKPRRRGSVKESKVIDLPADWPTSVAQARQHLLSDSTAGPFNDWKLPQIHLNSRWCDAFAVVSRPDDGKSRAIVQVPSANAATNQASQPWWQLKISAAKKLSQTGRTSDHWFRVLDYGPAHSPPYVILDRSPEAKCLADLLHQHRSLAEPAYLEVAIALCGILDDLNDLGIHLLSLPLEGLHIAWEPGNRMVRLADPTSVIPDEFILPEWRHLSSPVPIKGFQSHGRSQVFLIAALLLSCLRRNDRFLHSKGPAKGRSASLALLIGNPEWVDREAKQITESLVASLKSGNRCAGIQIQVLVEHLRWALSENPSQRYPNPREFGLKLRACLG